MGPQKLLLKLFLFVDVDFVPKKFLAVSDKNVQAKIAGKKIVA